MEFGATVSIAGAIVNRCLDEVFIGGTLGGINGCFWSVVVASGKTVKRHQDEGRALGTFGRKKFALEALKGTVRGFVHGGVFELVARYGVYRPLKQLTNCVLWESCSSSAIYFQLIPLTCMGASILYAVGTRWMSEQLEKKNLRLVEGADGRLDVAPVAAEGQPNDANAVQEEDGEDGVEGGDRFPIIDFHDLALNPQAGLHQRNQQPERGDEA